MSVLVVVLGVLVAGLAGVLAGGAVVWRGSRRGLLAQRRVRRVIVTLKSGEAFGGLLYAADRECVVLREAEALAFRPDQSNVIVEGEALIFRADVAYIQLP